MTEIYFSQFGSLGSLESGVPACLGSGERPLPHQMAIFFPPYRGRAERKRKVSGVSSYKGTKTIHKGSTLVT